MSSLDSTQLNSKHLCVKRHTCSCGMLFNCELTLLQVFAEQGDQPVVKTDLVRVISKIHIVKQNYLVGFRQDGRHLNLLILVSALQHLAQDWRLCFRFKIVFLVAC